MAALNVRSTCLVFALAGFMGLCAPAASAQQTVLFMGQGPTTTDNNVMDRIRNVLGHNVSYVNHDDAAAWAAALPGADMILISSTTSSSTGIGTMGGATAARDLNKPVMCYEDYCFDEVQTLASTGSTADTQITIANPGHALAAGLSGTVTIYSSATTVTHGSGAKGAGGVEIATINAGANYPILFYDTGDLLLDGTAAPAPRLNFFMHDTTFDSLTPDGVKLFDAAVNHMIPEPASLALLAVGALALVRRRRR